MHGGIKGGRFISSRVAPLLGDLRSDRDSDEVLVRQPTVSCAKIDLSIFSGVARSEEFGVEDLYCRLSDIDRLHGRVLDSKLASRRPRFW